MGDKKWWWGVAVAALIAYALAANLMPLQETTVAVDRTWSVESPDGVYCSEATVAGDLTIYQPFAMFRIPLVAPKSRATVGDGLAMQATNRLCAGQAELQAVDPEGNASAAAVVAVIIGDATCQQRHNADNFEPGQPMVVGDGCLDGSVRTRVSGPSGQTGRITTQERPVTAHGGCVDVTILSTLVERTGGSGSIITGEPLVDSICVGDES